jgi:two-component system OmpR family response regulator
VEIMVRILLLEDDVVTAGAVASGLAHRGYDVEHVPDVATALAAIDRVGFDAAVLDVMVPGGSGYDVLAALRAKSVGIPVLILTARDQLEDRVEGLDRGGDDYLVKPFALVELAARLRALLRRPATRVEVARVGDLEVDLLHRSARHGETLLALTPKELELLHCLVSRAGEVLTRKELLEQVWGYRFDPGTNVVEVHVNRLRRKLESAGIPGTIQTIRGSGYSINA